MPTSAAQDEFNALFNGAGQSSPSHPEDRDSSPQAEEPTSSASNGGRPAIIRSGRAAEDSSDSDNNNQENGFSSNRMGVSRPNRRDFIPAGRRPANTGPKGVIADAQAFQQAKRIHMSTLRLGNGNGTNPAAAPLMAHTDESINSWLPEDEEDIESDDDNDEFLSRWRQSRLRELTSNRGRVNNQLGSRSQRPAPASGRYGTLMVVDAVGYLNAIEKTPSDTVVLVFIYDDTSEVSAITELSVADLAKAHPSVRFIKLHYLEAQMEPAGVPAILAYRSGDKFAGLVPVLDEIPEDDDLSVESLREALRRHTVLL